MVLMFFSSSLLNSWAFYYQISVPLHIIFRSGSLLMNMLFSSLLLKKRYTFKQVIDVLLVTVGIILATLTSAHEKMTESKHSTFIQWVIGIVILLLALTIGSVLGVYQEVIYRKYGRVWKEALFYSHTISLPFFLIFSKKIMEDINIFNSFPPMKFSLNPYINFGISIPSSWIYLSLNIIAQYFCVTGVHKLSSISTSLTLNLILSLRKFVSLMLSIFIFNNPLKLGHWIGTIILFVGTIMYFNDTPSNISSNKKENNKKKKKKKKKKMENYPFEYIYQQVPVIAVVGLTSTLLNENSKEPRLQSKILEAKLNSPLTSIKGQLIQYFTEQNKFNAWDVYKKNTGFFHTIFFERDRLIQSHKTTTDPNVHSSISPLNPKSPLYPKGIMTSLWIQKYTSQIPCTMVLFTDMYEYNANDQSGIQEKEYDKIITNEITERKKKLSRKRN